MNEPTTPPPDLAATLLSRTAQRSAKAVGGRPQRPSRRLREAQYSGPGADERDPIAAAEAINSFLDEQGWRERTRVAAAVASWPDIAGAEVAAHVQAESFEAGVLTLRADSTAWATQMRMLAGSVRNRLDAALGTGVVSKVVVRGPEPPRTKGRWRVAGRGPRDTYG